MKKNYNSKDAFIYSILFFYTCVVLFYICIFFYNITFAHKFAILGAGFQFLAIVLTGKEIKKTRLLINNFYTELQDIFIDKFGNIIAKIPESKLTINFEMDSDITIEECQTLEQAIKLCRILEKKINDMKGEVRTSTKTSNKKIDDIHNEFKETLDDFKKSIKKIIMPSNNQSIINTLFFLGVLFSVIDLFYN